MPQYNMWQNDCHNKAITEHIYTSHHDIVCVKTFEIQSLSNFQVYNTDLLTTVTMLFIRSRELIH